VKENKPYAETSVSSPRSSPPSDAGEYGRSKGVIKSLGGGLGSFLKREDPVVGKMATCGRLFHSSVNFHAHLKGQGGLNTGNDAREAGNNHNHRGQRGEGGELFRKGGPLFNYYPRGSKICNSHRNFVYQLLY